MEDAQLTAHLARSRNHLCNLARKWLCRNAYPLQTIHRYSHILDKECLRQVVYIANVLHPDCAKTLIDAVIPYVPHKWLRDMDPKQAILTTARFILPIDKVIAGIDNEMSPIIYGPILGHKHDWPSKISAAISVVGAAQHAYKHLVAGRRFDDMCEFKDLIGLIGRGGNRSMLIRALKIWNERKHEFMNGNYVFCASDSVRYPECNYDLITGGALFSLPLKYAIAAMDFIMTEYGGDGMYINESTIHYLLYKSPCLHYKVWDFVINRILDARNYIDADAWLAGLVHNILRRGCLYARLPQSTLHRIVIQFPMAVSPKIFGPRDVAVAKLAMIGGSD